RPVAVVVEAVADLGARRPRVLADPRPARADERPLGAGRSERALAGASRPHGRAPAQGVVRAAVAWEGPAAGHPRGRRVRERPFVDGAVAVVVEPVALLRHGPDAARADEGAVDARHGARRAFARADAARCPDLRDALIDHAVAVVVLAVAHLGAR